MTDEQKQVAFIASAVALTSGLALSWQVGGLWAVWMFGIAVITVTKIFFPEFLNKN